jgi:nitrite reductase/ring-hydroxylating ferredoxin subunit
MFVEAARIGEIYPGGMKAVVVGGNDIVIANADGRYYAVSRRCSHRGVSLEMGTLDGSILTCPLHYAQFDITNGEVLSGPVPPDPDHPTDTLKTYPVQLQANSVMVSV